MGESKVTITKFCPYSEFQIVWYSFGIVTIALGLLITSINLAVGLIIIVIPVFLGLFLYDKYHNRMRELRE